MNARPWFHNLLAAGLLALLPSFLMADEAALDDLFTRLKAAEGQEAERIESDIWREWSKSGSAAMDLLLERGREAMAAGDLPQAIEHLTALVDHAPDFAEGWNARATAYYQAGEIGPSIADIRRTLALNPRHFGALSGFGMILEELGKPEEALEVYKAAIAIHPHLQGVLDAIERLETAETGQGI
jgi:tetratricopeptide (TPR) repeat protein